MAEALLCSPTMKDLLVSSLSVVAKTLLAMRYVECTIDLEDELNVTGCGICAANLCIWRPTSPMPVRPCDLWLIDKTWGDLSC